MTAFRAVTGDTLSAFLKMKTTPEQEGFVAPNAVTFAQSIYEKGSEIWGIFDGDRAVGLIALVDMAHPEADLDEGDDPDGVYVWRLMISAEAQGKGHGWAALEFARERARTLGRAHLALSSVDAPGSGIPFYERFGFVKTGRIVDDEVELILRPV